MSWKHEDILPISRALMASDSRIFHLSYHLILRQVYVNNIALSPFLSVEGTPKGHEEAL